MTQCNTGIAVGVIASILVAAGLGASLYVTTTGTDSNGNTTTTTTTTESTTTGNAYQTPCGVCGPKIDVALSVVNTLVEPYFNHSVELYGMRQQELIVFLAEAAKTRQEFRCAGNYGKWGFFVDTINGLKADYNLNKTWWKITDQDMVSLSLGVSSYIPQHQETLIFTFVQSDGH
ncbi:uncharacterized protein LOC124287385 [Haliotis rubra]|uniref:uncharacterized protein LOC124287385 n=1 Tax=Haliotis rubra TaxID=36100 RepID=UPI001EE61DEF|nr:uncharacterized protein LOC124287385 [Haliotis rubra]